MTGQPRVSHSSDRPPSVARQKLGQPLSVLPVAHQCCGRRAHLHREEPYRLRARSEAEAAAESVPLNLALAVDGHCAGTDAIKPALVELVQAAEQDNGQVWREIRWSHEVAQLKPSRPQRRVDDDV